MYKELEPCPFCGKNSGTINVECGLITCGNTKCPFSGKFILVETWNTRPVEDKLRAEIEGLKAELADVRDTYRELHREYTLDKNPMWESMAERVGLEGLFCPLCHIKVAEYSAYSDDIDNGEGDDHAREHGPCPECGFDGYMELMHPYRELTEKEQEEYQKKIEEIGDRFNIYTRFEEHEAIQSVKIDELRAEIAELKRRVEKGESDE